MRTSMLIATLLGLAACGGADATGACENYIAAVNSCYEEAGATAPIDDTFCAAYDETKGDAAKQAEELLNCYADTIDGGDCTDATKAGETYAAIADCDAA